jgi:hypothetical protein
MQLAVLPKEAGDRVKRTKPPPMTLASFQRLKQAGLRMRTERAAAAVLPDVVTVYHDALLQASVVVETAANTLWLVPCVQGGWNRRERLVLSTEARAERLTLARDVDPAWLGITSVTPDVATLPGSTIGPDNGRTATASDRKAST